MYEAIQPHEINLSNYEWMRTIDLNVMYSIYVNSLEENGR